MNWLKNPQFYPEGTPSVGLLFLRLFMGYTFVNHGWGKIQSPFNWMGEAPVPGFLQALAALSEFGGGLALIFGVLVHLACFGIMCTMFVAALSHIQKGAPLVGKGGWELAAIYFVIALMLFLTGPGKISLDYLLFGRSRASKLVT